jgi:DNA-binding XRE family transcriptional regulator
MNMEKTLRDARLTKGYTQKEVGAAIKLSDVQICNIETGKCHPSLQTRRALQNLFGCTLKFDAPVMKRGRPKQQMRRTK